MVEPPPAGPSPGPHPTKYWAFLSYSRRDDAVVRRLHRAIESYVVPASIRGRPTPNGPIPRRLFPIFRDVNELAATDSLPDGIRKALRDSCCLLVVCSPHGAASRWVEEEIRTFRCECPGRPILAVVLDGEPNGSARPELGMPEAFPPALRAVDPSGVGAQPLAADLRAGHDRPSLARLRLIAGILGVAFDDLYRRDRRRRRRQLAAVSAIALASALTLGIFVRSERRQVERASRQAEITQLLRRAREAAATSPEVAVILASRAGMAARREGLAREDARRVLVDVVEACSGIGLGDLGARPSIAIGPDGRRAFGSGRPRDPSKQPLAVLWDLESPDPPTSRHTLVTDAIDRPVFDPTGRWLLTAREFASDTFAEIRDLRAAPSTTRRLVPWANGPIDILGFVRDSRGLLLHSPGKPPRVWDLETGRGSTATDLVPPPGSRAQMFVASPDHRWLAGFGLSSGERLTLWDLSAVDPNASRFALGPRDMDVWMATFSGNGRRLLVQATTKAFTFDLSTPDPSTPEAEAELPGFLAHSKGTAAISPDGRRIAISTPYVDEPLPSGGIYRRDVGSLLLWDVGPAGMRGPRVLLERNAPERLAFSDDGRWLASIRLEEGRSGQLWDLDDPDGDPVDLPKFHAADRDPSVLDAWFDPAGDRLWVCGYEFVGVHSFGERLELLESLSFNIAGRRLGLTERSADRRWILRLDESEPVLYLWSLAPMAGPLRLAGHGAKVTDATFSLDGRRLLTASEDGSVRLHDLTRLDPSSPFPGRVPFTEDPELRAARSRARRASQSRWEVQEETRPVVVFDWDVGNPVSGEGHPQYPLTTPDQEVSAVATSADRRWAAIAEAGGAVTVWSFDSEFRSRRRWDSGLGTIAFMAFDQAGGWLLGRSEDGRTAVWPLPRGEEGEVPADEPRPFAFGADAPAVASFAVDPDGDAILVCDREERCRLWIRDRDGRPTRSADLGRLDRVDSVDLSANRVRLVASSGTRVLCWDLAEPSHPAAPEAFDCPYSPEAVRVDRRGRIAAASVLDDVHAWDLGRPKPADSLRILPGRPRALIDLVANVAGTWLAINDDDGAILWDLASNPEAGPDAAWSGWTATGFGDGDDWLLLRHRSGRVDRYPLSLEAALGLARAAAGRNLRAEEWGRLFPGTEPEATFDEFPTGR